MPLFGAWDLEAETETDGSVSLNGGAVRGQLSPLISLPL